MMVDTKNDTFFIYSILLSCTAKELLNKEIKIESTAIEEIKAEMETIIAK